jgi:hypothetical protein
MNNMTPTSKSASEAYDKAFGTSKRGETLYDSLGIKPKYIKRDDLGREAPEEVNYYSGQLADSAFSSGISGLILSAFSQGPQKEWGGSDDLYETKAFKGLVKTNKYLDELIEYNKHMSKEYNETILRPNVKEPSFSERFDKNLTHTHRYETLMGIAERVGDVDRNSKIAGMLRERGDEPAAKRYEEAVKRSDERYLKQYDDLLPWYESKNPVASGAVALTGALVGSMTSPEAFINRIPGITPLFEKFLTKTLGTKGAQTALAKVAEAGLTQGTVNAALDPAIQGANIGLGSQKEWNWQQTALSFPAGVAVGSITQGATEFPAWLKTAKFSFDATTARAKGIVGEGEEGFFNTRQPSEQDLAARQEAADLTSVSKEEALKPPREFIDINELAREVDPDTYTEYDRLIAKRDKLRNSLQNNNSQAWNELKIEKEMSEILDPVGWDETKLQEWQVKRLDQLRIDLKTAKETVWTPSMEKTQAELMKTDETLRDLIPARTEARERAKGMLEMEGPRRRCLS